MARKSLIGLAPSSRRQARKCDELKKLGHNARLFPALAKMDDFQLFTHSSALDIQVSWTAKTLGSYGG
jgi:hypothetical protein